MTRLPKHEEGYHFVTMVTYQRAQLFKHTLIARKATETIAFYEKRGDIELFGYVIMPDHIHMICRLNEDRVGRPDPTPIEIIQTAGSRRSPDLRSVMGNMRKYIAKEAVQYLSDNDTEMLLQLRLPQPKKRHHFYQIWQDDYYDFNILTEKTLLEKLKYLYENPIRKRLCSDILDYEFSNARRYFGINGSGDP